MDAHTRLGFALVSAMAALMVTPRLVEGQTPASGIPCRYEIAHIIQGPPCSNPAGYIFTVGTSISPSGRYVCGYYGQCPISGLQPFLYDTQTEEFRILPLQASAFTIANDVNDEYVVGRASDYGFLYQISTGQVTLLPPAIPVGQGSCTVSAINSRNTVCGTRTIGGAPNYPKSAFLWSAQTGFTDVGLIDGQSTLGWDISESGKLVGHYPQNDLSSTARAFTFENGVVQVIEPIPDGLNSYTRSVLPTGELLVNGLLTLSPTYLGRTYLYDNNQFARPFGLPPGCDRGGPSRMNSSRTGAGACNDLPTGTWRGVVWFGTSPRVLNDITEMPASYYIRSATGISDGGVILADNETLDGKRNALVLAPVFSPGDTNCDARVNVNDLLNVINTWGPCDACQTDLNGDQIVNLLDLLLVIENWSAGG